jgi:hypothetical protein
MDRSEPKCTLEYCLGYRPILVTDQLHRNRIPRRPCETSERSEDVEPHPNGVTGR